MASKVLFEDALSMTGFGKFNFFMVLLSGSLIMGMAFEIFSVAYLVPASACELVTTNFQQGLMASVPLVGIIATSHFWGYLADTRGRKKILFLSMILGFVTGAASALSPNWIVFSVLKFISSSAVSGTLALAITLLGECTPERRRTTLISLISSMYIVSMGLMAIMTIPILSMKFSYYIPFLDIHFNSWRLLTLIYSVPCAFGALCVSFAYESPKYLLSIGDEAGALEVLRKIYALNERKTREEFPVSFLTLDEAHAQQVKGLWSSIVSQTLPLFKPPLIKNALLLSALFFIIYFCINPYSVWFPYVLDGFMRSIQGGDESFTFCQMLRSSQNVTMSETTDCSLNESAMIMVFSVNMFLASLNVFLSTIINIIGRKRLLISIQFISGISGLLVSCSSNWMVSGPLFIIFVSGILNFGFLSTFSIDMFPTYVKAMAVCLTLMVGRGSSVLGINLLKDMLVYNCESSFYYFGGLTVVGGLVALLLPPDAKTSSNKSLETVEK